MPWSQGGNATLAERIRAIRMELFGESGGPMLASLLRIPYRRVVLMEGGGPITAPVILRFIEVTGVNPHWLLSGEGERYGCLAASGPLGRGLGRQAAE
jgi:hypothetical protein